jgi:hypothetical protein
MPSPKQAQAPRAQRFPFCLPLHYHIIDAPNWHTGKTVNISRTGILFQTDESLPISSTLDIRVQFPSAMTLTCQGFVVRTLESACAVFISRSQLSRNGK